MYYPEVKPYDLYKTFCLIEYRVNDLCEPITGVIREGVLKERTTNRFTNEIFTNYESVLLVYN